MSSREEMLKTIRNNKPKKVTEIPDIRMEHASYEDKNAKFSAALASVGGNALFLDNLGEIDAYVREHYKDATVIVSNVEGLNVATRDANASDDPHTLRDVDLAIIKGQFAVAENGSVWVKEDDNRHRALYFITQKLMIVVSKSDIVPTMHEAYEKISFENNSGFGVFISGPSKTADIEQALVIGAHGATEACVVFV